MQYQVETQFSTDYPFNHYMIDNSIAWSFDLDHHPLVVVVEDPSDWPILKYRPEVANWIKQNFKIYCNPVWVTSKEYDHIVAHGAVRFAFANREQAMRFKLKFTDIR